MVPFRSCLSIAFACPSLHKNLTKNGLGTHAATILSNFRESAFKEKHDQIASKMAIHLEDVASHGQRQRFEAS